MNPALTKAYECFLRAQVSQHTHALTVTLKIDSSAESFHNRRTRLETTVRHLLYRIGRKCFKNRHKKAGLRIACVTVIEGGKSLGRLHAHLSLALPNGMPDAQFQKIVLTAVHKCKSLGEQCVLKHITNSDGWADYMAKDGLEAFSPLCTQRAKHRATH